MNVWCYCCISMRVTYTLTRFGFKNMSSAQKILWRTISSGATRSSGHQQGSQSSKRIHEYMYWYHGGAILGRYAYMDVSKAKNPTYGMESFPCGRRPAARLGIKKYVAKVATRRRTDKCQRGTVPFSGHCCKWWCTGGRCVVSASKLTYILSFLRNRWIITWWWESWSPWGAPHNWATPSAVVTVVKQMDTSWLQAEVLCC